MEVNIIGDIVMRDFCTLCYIEKDDKYLMLHRTKKEGDINKNKWIGVGGHFEDGESPEDCVMREVFEETGLTLTAMQFRGVVTFISGNGLTEYMFLFTANNFEGELIDCDEGELVWIPKDLAVDLEIWEGDKIFLNLIADNEQGFFSLKLVYNREDDLVEAVLDGEQLELKK